MPRRAEMESAIRDQHALYLRNQPTTLRRCLCCDDWMHSTGPGHRVCNPCKGEPGFAHSRVGERVKQGPRARGIRADRLA